MGILMEAPTVTQMVTPTVVAVAMAAQPTVTAPVAGMEVAASAELEGTECQILELV